ncbi:hypothetical protein PoB_004620800 [Plakobranchus ocellatus]|uniref:Uncharacterized protein n=1 Tax=Plakobranchus ocellatus TaxID=259542 RepID=A0AAV4BJE2_9GAST|nr:hypothetical protein PoB_004620800 [Plakobranchus ocellatus]
MLRGQTSSTKNSPTWEKTSAKEVKKQVENGRRHALDDGGRHVDLEEDVGANETQLAQSSVVPLTGEDVLAKRTWTVQF